VHASDALARFRAQRRAGERGGQAVAALLGEVKLDVDVGAQLATRIRLGGDGVVDGTVQRASSRSQTAAISSSLEAKYSYSELRASPVS